MSFIIGVLLFVLFLNALFLILLILVQLPKKEAGIGMAFGGGAGEALFQGGAANALSKMTTKAAIVFLSVTLLVSIMVSANSDRSSASKVNQLLSEDAESSLPSAESNATNATPVAVAPTGNVDEISIPVPQGTEGDGSQPVEIQIPVPAGGGDNAEESTPSEE